MSELIWKIGYTMNMNKSQFGQFAVEDECDLRFNYSFPMPVYP